MRYLSLFSGIEAATIAWEPLGWTPVAFAEIEPFPAAVLAHHWPHVPNLGDVRRLRDALLLGAPTLKRAARHPRCSPRQAAWLATVAGLLDNPPDVLVGGSPCQSFSIAGARRSLTDARGNLTLVYAEIVHAINPRFVVWENVPGVFSTKDNAFGHFLAALVGADAPLVSPKPKRWGRVGVVDGPRRSAAWRVLDAQYFGVPQRRRRVFLLSGRAGDRIHPAELLFEPEGLQRDSAPQRPARQAPAGAAGTGAAPDRGAANHHA